MIYKLLIEDDEGQTTDVPLIRNQISIGRAEENTICLRERNVSRKHAEITLDNGQILIADRDSFNGVWINGELVRKPTLIKPGDLIEVGDYHLSLRVDKDDGVDNAVPSLPPENVPQPNSSELATMRVPLEDSLQNGDLGPRLVLLNSAGAGQEFALTDSALTIGRKDEGNDIGIDHASVSKVHAKISFSGSSYRLADLNSSNGIRVNGEEHDACDLQWGDIIELGTVQLQLLAPGDPSPVSSRSADALSSPGSISSANTLPAASGSSASLPQGGPPTLVIGAVVAALVLGLVGFFVLTSSSKKQAKQPATDAAVATSDRDKPPPRRELTDKQRLAAAKKDLLLGNFEKAGTELKKLLLKRSDWKEPQQLLNSIAEEKPHFALYNKAFLLQTDRKTKPLKKALKMLKDFPRKSLFAEKAEKLRLEVRNELVKLLLTATEKQIAEKKYFEAIQTNNEALELDPKNKRSKVLHKRLERLTSGTSLQPPSTSPDPDSPGSAPPPRSDEKPKTREPAPRSPTNAPPSRR